MTGALVLRGATVYPGSGVAFVGDVAVAEGRIAYVTQCHEERPPRGAADVDARGLMLCPGFIDLHAHSALSSFSDPLQVPKVAQGFTTEVICPDGLAPAPVTRERWRDRRDYLKALEGPGPEEWEWETVDQYLEALDATKPTTSLVPSAAHGAIRDVVVGADDAPPTRSQLAEMRAHVRAALEAGARMLSFGLVYLPGAHAGTDELVTLAEEAALAGVPIVPHVRNEGAGLLDAIEEMLEVARRSGAALHLSHLKALADEGMVGPLLDLLDRASADVDLSFDQYPYGAGSTLLASILPRWAQEGGADASLERLHRPADRARIARDIANGLPGWENLLGTLGPDRIAIAAAAPPNADAAGKTLAELARDEKLQAGVHTALELLRSSRLDVTMILHYAGEDAVREIARHRLQLVGSDGIFGPRPHPRLWGTAARFLGRYAMRDGLLPIDEAVARLTSRPAALLGLSDRGRIAPGLRADLVLLDTERLVDTATYDDPCRPPDGVVGVWVAGERVWREGAHTGARPGGVVRRQTTGRFGAARRGGSCR
jgi:N-acyl-D-amino-acid deacylase